MHHYCAQVERSRSTMLCMHSCAFSWRLQYTLLVSTDLSILRRLQWKMMKRVGFLLFATWPKAPAVCFVYMSPVIIANLVFA